MSIRMTQLTFVMETAPKVLLRMYRIAIPVLVDLGTSWLKQIMKLVLVMFSVLHTENAVVILNSCAQKTLSQHNPFNDTAVG